MSKVKSPYNVAINDADYRTNVWETVGRVDGKQKQVLVWRCPFMALWKSILERGYSERFKKKCPSYKDCTIDEDWLTFSNFKAWMEQQDYAGMHLDKDLLVPRNKHYGPKTCVFVSREVNNFIQDFRSSKAGLPPGVICETRARGKFGYRAECMKTYVGFYPTIREAHLAWLDAKLRFAKELAGRQTNPSVADAIIFRYENFHTIYPLDDIMQGLE